MARASKQSKTATKPKGKRNGANRKSTPGTFTPEKRAQFLELYAGGGTVRHIASLIDISVVTIYKTIRTDSDFKAAYLEAQETNTDALEDLLHEMAMGMNVTAIFGILRARRPERWRENHQVNVKAEGSFPVAFALAMRAELDDGIKPRDVSSPQAH